MLLKPHHIFTHKGKAYLLNIEELAPFQIDESVVTMLKGISLDPCFSLNRRLKEYLRRFKLIAPKSQIKKKKASSAKLSPVRNIALFVTQNCNLDCSYCYGNGGGYGSSGHMKRETAIKAVDWLTEQSGQVKKLGISFFGGEPFLNFPLMKEVVDYAQQLGLSSGKEFEFSVTTNASLLDEEKITFLKENRVTPLLSFDGSKKTQDAQRPFKGGRGSYEKIVPKIKQLLKVFPETTARATLVGKTDPIDVIKALHEIGFSSTHITAASPSLFDREGEKSENGSNNEKVVQLMEAEAEEILENIKSRNIENLKKLKKNGILITRLGEFLNKQKKYFACGAGRAYVGVSNAGDVYLCHRFVGMGGYKFGHVSDKVMKRDGYLESPIKIVKKCAKCFAKYTCGGGCYHVNLGDAGSVFEPSNVFCRTMQRSVEMIVYVSSQLSERDRIFMAKNDIVAPKPCPFDFPK